MLDLDTRDAVASALRSGAGALDSGRERTRGAERRLIDEILERIETAKVGRSEADAGAELGRWLARLAGDEDQRATLGDVLGLAARRLAPTGEPPSRGGEAQAWQALLVAVEQLYGGGAHPLGRPAFMTDALLSRLVAEAAEALPERPDHGKQMAAMAGTALARLAVSRQLREAASDALGFSVAPTYHAVYTYDPPGSVVPTHVDVREYEFVVHLALEHTPPPAGVGGSALRVHRPGEPDPIRIPLAPGEAVLLRGRGTLHSWEPLGEGERRILVAVGFERAN